MADNLPEQPAAEDQEVPAESAPVTEAVPAEAPAAPPPDLNGLAPDEVEQLRANEVAFSWQASEYVHHHKGLRWYAGFIGATVLLGGAAVLLHYWTTVIAFGVMAGAVLVYAHKPPRTLLYELSHEGIMIDGRQYPFSEFRSFGVIPETEWHTIDLEPVKRFSPRITVLFEDDDFEEIVGHLELHLPRIDRKPDVIERATRYLRF
jgi:hypothetical protein